MMWSFSYLTAGQRVDVVIVLFRRANIIGSVGWQRTGGVVLRSDVDELAWKQDKLIVEALQERLEEDR